MSQVMCPECGFKVGLGVASEPGTCPSCGLALMLTTEFRALDAEQLRAEAERRAALDSVPVTEPLPAASTP